MFPFSDPQNIVAMKIAITIVKVLMAITFGLIAGLAVMLLLPLLFTFALIKIIGGAAASIR
jgi:cell division septal protein FtsQ